MVHYRIHYDIPGGDVTEDAEAECADNATARLLAFAGVALGDSREVWRGAPYIGVSIAAPFDARLASCGRTQPRMLLRID
jgi:hypothetical protein